MGMLTVALWVATNAAMIIGVALVFYLLELCWGTDD